MLTRSTASLVTTSWSIRLRALAVESVAAMGDLAVGGDRVLAMGPCILLTYQKRHGTPLTTRCQREDCDDLPPCHRSMDRRRSPHLAVRVPGVSRRRPARGRRPAPARGVRPERGHP